MSAYFSFGSGAGASFAPHELVLFSGGLDSLAGTVEALVADKVRRPCQPPVVDQDRRRRRSVSLDDCARASEQTGCFTFRSGPISLKARFVK